MGAGDKLQALKSKGFGSTVFGAPPTAKDAPNNLRKSEVIPEGDGSGEVATVSAVAAVKAPGVKKKAKREKPEGLVQINGRVTEDVRLAIQIASKTHKKEIGEVITEAFALWQKQHG